MKLKEGFVIRMVASNWVVMPVGEAVINFNGILVLNDTGAFIWQKLKEGCSTKDQLIDLITAEYDIDRKQAILDMDCFVAKLTDAGCLEMEI